MMEDLKGFRKFIFVLLGAICATLALVLGKITQDTWLAAMQWLGGFFVVGNIAEHVKEAFNGDL